MGDGSVDITKWIEHMVHKNGLTSFKVEFQKPSQPPQPEVSHDRTPGKEQAESAHTANPALQTTMPASKETPGPSQWQDLDTLLFPEDKEG